MNAQTLSVIFASEIFKTNPQMVLSAIALASGPEAVAALPEAPAALPEAPAALPEAAAALPEAPAPAAELKRAPSAWNVLVEQTVRDMRENGWAAFTDVEGTLWPASRPEGDKHVYSEGKHAGKEASRAIGGFKLASLRNSESKPEAAAAALARLEKREAVKAARRAEAPAEAPKKARKPQSEETKAAAAIKRAATKAAKAAAAADDSDASSVTATTEEDVPLLLVGSATKACRSCKHELPLVAFQKARRVGEVGEIRVLKCCDTCREKQNVRTAEGGHNARHNAAAKAARHALKAAAAAGEPEAIAAVAAARAKHGAAVAAAHEKRVAAAREKHPFNSPRLTHADLTLDLWKHDGAEYYRNEANDVISLDGEWVGRWTGSAIDTAAPEPAYFDTLTTRE
jgi:hypothetical protein